MKTLHIATTISEYSDLNELEPGDLELIDKAREASQKAYAPYSGFNVGAAVLLENGEIITGNNQENAAYPSGLCAERVALFYANANFPNEKILAMAIVAGNSGSPTKQPVYPCGSCRQVMIETEQKLQHPIRLILSGTEITQVIEGVQQLLPVGFDKTMLSKEDH